MMEYQAVLKIGKGKMKVPFSDGSVSAVGMKPATFTTDNLMIQHAIENSSDYERGLIFKVGSITLSEDVEICRNGKPGPIEEKQEKEEVKDRGLKRVEVSCNDDAKDYLEKEFGVLRSKMKVRADILSFAELYGIEFVFTK